MHYNLLQFGNSCPPVTVNQKINWLNGILNYYQPDIFTVNELAPQSAYSQNIRLNAFTYTESIEFGGITNESNSQIVNNIFYNEAIFRYEGVEVIEGGIRDINVYTLSIQSTLLEGGENVLLHCIVAHFKAGSSANDRELREFEAQAIMDWLEENPDKQNILLMGDLNFGTANEIGFQTLVRYGDSSISWEDPSGTEGGWGGATHAAVHTQSTRSNSSDCGVAGGMDDRFDMILLQPALLEGSNSISYVDGSYEVLGNSGNSFNAELSCDGQAVPIVICANLKQMSDHLPVVMELEIGGIPITSQIASLDDIGVRVVSPFDEMIEIDFAHAALSGKNIELRLVDMMGKEWYRNHIELSQSITNIATGHIPVGVYGLQVEDQSGRRWGRKIIKSSR